jgi:hypothetical protein
MNAPASLPTLPTLPALALAPLQQAFQDFVLGTLDEAAIAPHIAVRGKLSSAERLSIYHNAYRVRLRDALCEAYDKTHAYLGDDLFYDACAHYCAQNPSHSSNLRWYGATFAPFLAEYFAQHPVVAELAAFEWTLSLAFDAENQAILPLSALAQVQPQAWENIGFAVHASVHFLPLHSNCVAIWLALADDSAATAGPEVPAASWQEAAHPWLIWRKNLQPHFRSISAAEYQALASLQAGQSFAEVCDAAAESHPEAAPQIAQWLQSWIGEQVLHDFNRTPI